MPDADSVPSPRPTENDSVPPALPPKAARAAAGKRHILFVDDEPQLLEALGNRLRRLRSAWDMRFVDSAEKALACLAEGRFDVVVSDLKLQGKSGVELLGEVKQRVPDAVRIILSGTADAGLAVGAAELAHQFLAKPCEAEVLRTAIERSLALRDLLTSERLARVASRLRSLPPVPALYLEIRAALGRENGSIEEVGKIVARDVAMSAKVLQLVNSSVFGLARRVTNAADATAYLGLDTLTALVLSSQVFEHAGGVSAERLELLWTHSLRAAAAARAIAKLEACDVKQCDQAFLAGMLHEVGLLLLMNELEGELLEAWKYVRRFGVPLCEGERRVIGASHAAVGAYLMGIWGLPDSVVQAIAFHHTPSLFPDQGLSILTAVHAATVLDCGPEGSAFGETEAELDRTYLERLGLGARFAVWRDECARLRAEEGKA